MSIAKYAFICYTLSGVIEVAYKDKAKAITYINQYNAAKYDRITIMLPHGDRETLKAHAAACGESVNSFIKRAIQEAMERDKKAGD